MTARYSNEEFINKLKYINNSIIPLEKYITSSTKIFCKCSICKNVWGITPNKLLSGRGCPICANNNKRKTHNEFINELYTISPNITVLGSYINDYSKIKVKCNIDDNVWETTPSCLLQGTKCMVCKIRHELIPHEHFITQIEEISPSIKILDSYKGNKKRITAQCKVCSHIWKPYARTLKQGHGCPVCKKSGFNPSKPAQLYVYKTNIFCGFGITNIPKTRHTEHTREFKRKGLYGELIYAIYGNGIDIMNLEKEIKNNFKIFPQEISGFKTEAIHLDDIEILLEFIKNKLHSHKT